MCVLPWGTVPDSMSDVTSPRSPDLHALIKDLQCSFCWLLLRGPWPSVSASPCGGHEEIALQCHSIGITAPQHHVTVQYRPARVRTHTTGNSGQPPFQACECSSVTVLSKNDGFLSCYKLVPARTQRREHSTTARTKHSACTQHTQSTEHRAHVRSTHEAHAKHTPHTHEAQIAQQRVQRVRAPVLYRFEGADRACSAT